MVALQKLTILFLPALVLAKPIVSERAGPRDLTSQATFVEDSDDSHVMKHESVDVEDRSRQEIYEAARKENGTLRIGWGGDVQQSKKSITDAFKAEYPDIKFEILLDPSKYIDSKVDMAYRESDCADHGFDMVVLQTTANFPRWKEEGRLLPYKVIPWDDMHPEFIDEDGYYAGMYILSFGTQVYNPKVMDNSSLPTSYLDYLRPEWANKIILTYPNDDDAVLYLFKLITEKYGFAYMHELQKQNVTWVRGTGTPSILIGNTNPHNDIEPEMGHRHSQSISFTSSAAYAPVSIHAHSDVVMTWPQTGAIFATTKMPESAKLFLNFLMDDGYQARITKGKYATRRKFDGAGVLDQSDIDPLGYSEFMSDRQQVESLRFAFEKVLGTPMNQNPVEVW